MLRMRNLFLLVCFVCLWGSAKAQSPAEPSPSPTLRVGTKLAEPFVMERPDGSLYGLSIDLWEEIASRQGWDFEYAVYPDVPSLVTAIAADSVDVGAAALSITAPREAQFDFTLPFYATGLRIATRSESQGIWYTLTRFFSWEFLSAIGALALVIFIFGFLVWLVERKRNSEQFASGLRGLGAGFWWSAVTMTTVGYGDKAPVTPAGRLIGLVWMFLALIIFGGFTAAITSAFTANRIANIIENPEDLKRVRVATVANTNSVEFLIRNKVGHLTYESPQEAMEALNDREIEAVVYDEPILRHEINQNYQGDLRLAPQVLQTYFYGFGVPEGHDELLETLNQEVMQFTASQAWDDLEFQYLGEKE